MKFGLLVSLLTFTQFALADVWVKGYTKSNGTQVDGHYRSSPNSTAADNYSTKGNYNPHTGATGTREYDASTSNALSNTDSSSFNK